MKRPFLTTGLAMLCTMFLLFSIGALYTLLLVIAVCAISSVFVFLRHRTATVPLLAGLAALIAVSSFTYRQENLINTAMLYCGENITVSGTLADYPTETNERYIYHLQNCTLGTQQTSFSLHLSDEAYYECKPGDTLQFTALKIYPSAEKDSQYYYSTMSKGVYLRAYTDSVTVHGAEKQSLRYLPVEIRHSLLDIIADRLQSTHASILSALLLGNTDTLSTQTALYFSTSGISHLFAVSGFHVSFWTGLILHIFRRRKKHILPNIFACAFLFFFMALTGFSVSVCRSGLMACVMFFGNMFRKEKESLNSLGLALTLILLHNPLSAADASLLLSAAATAAIILSSQPIDEFVTTPLVQKIKHKYVAKFIRYVSTLLCLSAAVTLSLMPLTSLLFGSFSLMTPIANILCVPTAQGTMIMGLLSVASNRVPYFSDFLFRLTEIFAELLLFFAKAISEIPVAMFILNTSLTILWAVVSLALIAIVHKKYNRLPRRAFFTAITCALSLILLFNGFSYINRKESELTIHDTGNASCITLHDRHGNAAIIGCGGDDYLVESLARQLRTKGVAQPRLLLIPDTTETESANAWAVNRLLTPDYVITKAWDTTKEEHILIAEQADIQLWKDTELHFESTQNFRATHIKTNDTDIVICFYPSSDFANADAVYQSGDILICRRAIPSSINTENFKQIILSSDKEEALYFFTEDLAQKITTTADEGSISILIE